MTVTGGVCPRCPSSPGIVDDTEMLAFGLYSPELFNPENGEITPEGLKVDVFLGGRDGHIDDCGNSTGLSFCRIAAPNGTIELQKTIDKIAQNANGRKIEGSAYILASDIRGITAHQMKGNIAEEIGKAFCILDDGCPEYTSHCVVRASQAVQNSSSKKSAVRGAREDLRKMLSKSITRSK